MNDRTVKIKKFIADMDSLEEVAVEMKNRGKTASNLSRSKPSC